MDRYTDAWMHTTIAPNLTCVPNSNPVSPPSPKLFTHKEFFSICQPDDLNHITGNTHISYSISIVLNTYHKHCIHMSKIKPCNLKIEEIISIYQLNDPLHPHGPLFGLTGHYSHTA